MQCLQSEGSGQPCHESRRDWQDDALPKPQQSRPLRLIRKAPRPMSNGTKIFYCKICEKSWSELPANSTKLTSNSGRGSVNVWKFEDGSTHAIILKRVP